LLAALEAGVSSRFVWSGSVREEIDLQLPVHQSRLRILISFSFFLRWIPRPVPAGLLFIYR
jgi:hypothetical protein